MSSSHFGQTLGLSRRGRGLIPEADAILLTKYVQDTRVVCSYHTHDRIKRTWQIKKMILAS